MKPAPSALRAVLAAVVLFAAAASAPAGEDGATLAGSLETRFEGALGAGGSGGAYSGFEEYANLRLKAAVGERGTVHAAANLVAASGSLLPPPGTDPAFDAGEGYAAALEVERLFFRLESDAADLEAGLLRMAFGHGQAWSPLDFLSPKNPLLPDARPRGILGASTSAFPSATARLKAFAATGKDPYDERQGGAVFGAAGDLHGEKASLQALYAYEAPSAAYTDGVHRAGLSLKLDAEAAVVLEGLYAYDGAAREGLRGFEAAAGIDYSLFAGKLYLVGQYLYNGPGALSPGDGLDALYDPAAGPWRNTAPRDRIPAAGVPYDELNRRNYLYASAVYAFDDFTRTTLDCVAGLDDLSFSPSLTVEHEPFQGAVLSLSLRLPLDERVLSGRGDDGELGPVHSGMRASITARARFKF